MSQWYVKELSEITGVSVQTLHHYDRIGLLKPSLRHANGYRVYQQRDLLKLQQILALKFFGFDLNQIRKLLASEKDALAHFNAQIESLEAKANALLEASAVLKQVVAEGKKTQTIPWNNIIKVIEVYRMSEQLDPWIKEIFTPEELKEYATFESEWKKNSTPEQRKAFETSWAALVGDIEANLNQTPRSTIGINIGKRCMDLINGVYGKKYAHLRTKKFEQGFGEGKGLDEVGLTPKTMTWLDGAVDAYLRERIFNVLKQVGSGQSDEAILTQWNDVLDELYGNQHERKKKLYDTILNDKEATNEMKEWLSTLKQLVEKNSFLQ